MTLLPMPPRRAFRLGYRPALDGLRGLAVLAVMLYHFGTPWLQGGFLGVDAFFVLSGFLITSLLVQEWSRGGRIAFARFYYRRALRLLPALLVMLGAVSIVALTVESADLRAATWRGLTWTLLYAANWQKVLSTAPVGMLGHTWSLSIEEQFYALWPPLLCLLLVRGTRLRTLAWLAAGAAAASAALRGVLYLLGAATTEQLYNGLHTRLDALLIGCAAALLLATKGPTGRPTAAASRRFDGSPTVDDADARHSGGALHQRIAGLWPGRAWRKFLWRDGSRRVVGSGLSLGICLPFAMARLDAARMYYVGFALFGCAVGALILGLASGRIDSPVLEWRPLVWLGARSYGVYLWHLPVHDTLNLLGLGSWPAPLAVCTCLALSVAIAAASYRWIETPALRLKDRIETRTARGPAQPYLEPRPAYSLVRID